MSSAETAAQDASNTFYIVVISCVATIGGFLFGFDSGVINGTVDGLQRAFDSDSVGTGFNVASMLLGCAVGAFFAGRLADRFGRRFIMRFAAAFFIISAWGSGIASGSTEFVFYRVLGGLAVGAASVLAPAYISEVAPARYRGALTTIQQVAIISGLFIAFVSNYIIAGAAGASTAEFWLGFEAWRWMFWIEMIPATIFLLALLLIPESPRYLVLIRKREEALAVLTRLNGESAAIVKVEEIDASLASDHHRPKMADLLDPKTRRIRRIVWVGIGLATFQQLVGINVVFYYGAVLWQSVGFAESDALLINVLSGALSIGAVTVTILIIDKIGRKPILLIGSIGMTVTLAVVRGGRIDFARRHLRADGTDRGKCVCRVFQFFLGPGHVGNARRDVPESDPGNRSGCERSCPVGIELCHHDDVPDHAGDHRSGRRLRLLYGVRGAFDTVRDQNGARNARRGTRRHARIV